MEEDRSAEWKQKAWQIFCFWKKKRLEVALPQIAHALAKRHAGE